MTLPRFGSMMLSEHTTNKREGMSITKRLDEARKAFNRKDLTASEAAHSPEAIAQASEQHGGASHQYIGDMVYGGLDGIVTTFAIVSGVAGANLGSGIILILGLANLLADGLHSGPYSDRLPKKKPTPVAIPANTTAPAPNIHRLGYNHSSSDGTVPRRTAATLRATTTAVGIPRKPRAM